MQRISPMIQYTKWKKYQFLSRNEVTEQGINRICIKNI